MDKYFTNGHLNELGIAYFSENPKLDEFRTHINSCDACYEQVTVLTDFLDEHSYITHKKMKRNYLSLAASVLVLLCSSIFFFVNQSNSFTENSSFEILVGDQLRSSSFEIITPEIDQHFKRNEQITFQWNIQNDKKCELIIFSNEKLVIVKHSVTNKLFNYKANLSEGLYYWELIENDEIIYVGKFNIVNTK